MHKSTPPQIRRQQYSSLEYSIRPNLGKPTQTNPLFSPNPPTKSTNSTPKTTQKRNQIVQTPTRPKNTTHPRNPPPPKTVGKHRRRIPAPVPLDSPRSGSAPAVESGLCAFACEGEGDEEKQRDKPYGESRAKQLRLKRKRS